MSAVKTRRLLHLALLAFGALSLDRTHAAQIPAQLGVGPDNHQIVLLNVINSAKRDLLVNVYELKSAQIASTLAQRIRAGVRVTLLTEGQPVTGLDRQAKEILCGLQKVMGEPRGRQTGSRLLVMRRMGQLKRRFRFDHAKYVVADGMHSYVASENFVENGHPDPGLVGNRGWGIAISDPALARTLTQVFVSDADPRHGDIDPRLDCSGVPHPSLTGPIAKKRQQRPIPPVLARLDRATIVSAPGALDDLLAMMRSARHSLAIEEMSLPLKWNGGMNPLVDEAVRIARSGIPVRILLNDGRVFNNRDNHATVEFLAQVQKAERIPLEARIVDVKALEITYIHNKGMIADGVRVMVGSINGTWNSSTNNREIAVVAEGTALGSYYGGAFDLDWRLSSRQSIAWPSVNGSAELSAIARLFLNPFSEAHP